MFVKFDDLIIFLVSAPLKEDQRRASADSINHNMTSMFATMPPKITVEYVDEGSVSDTPEEKHRLSDGQKKTNKVEEIDNMVKILFVINTIYFSRNF